MDSLIKTILDGNFASLKEYCDKQIAQRIAGRINEKKIEILAKINGKTVAEMNDIVSPVVETEEIVDEYVTEGKKSEKKEDPDAKTRNRGTVVFEAGSKNVTDDKDHFPINTEAQARNALARANQFKKAPKWYKGSLESLVKAVAKAVKKKYKGIEVTEKSTNPGKD